jgi:hypothetical protein
MNDVVMGAAGLGKRYGSVDALRDACWCPVAG